MSLDARDVHSLVLPRNTPLHQQHQQPMQTVPVKLGFFLKAFFSVLDAPYEYR
jgi:hypothetical protein